MKLLKDTLFGLVLGAGGMYLFYQLLGDEFVASISEASNGFQITFAVAAGIFTAILIHEGGHILAGLIQGFKIELLTVCFLGLMRKDGKLKFFFNSNLQYFGGVASTSPSKEVRNPKRAFAWILLAGPLASLLLGIGLLLIFHYTSTWFDVYFAISGIISVLLFLATTLPSKSGGFYTDRKRFQRLMNKGEIGRSELALIRTINQNYIDGDCSQLSEECLQTLKDSSEPDMQFWGHFFGAYKEKDRGLQPVSSEVVNRLQKYKEYFSKPIWESLRIESLAEE